MRFLARVLTIVCGSWATTVSPGSAAGAAVAPARQQEAIDFLRQVQPIFERRCYECHTAEKQKGGLRLDSKHWAFLPVDSGKTVIVPGEPEESPLMLRVTATDPDEVMPPKGERLSAEEIAILKGWIGQGAVWPAEEAIAHWAYVPPERPPLPEVKDAKWCRNEIDYFILARLEKEGLEPSPEADRATLIRRVSLDLIGLPPAPEEVEAFLADQSADAYEAVVDRLLTSVHYGERWARPWLDLARYADTQGYEKDNRRSIWPYRDWVIRALNDDMPFDQFTVEQLAGDMLPDATQEQKVATGFHRNTMTNTEGGTDNEEFRHEALVDRINTTMSVWMGTTFACAQCHNHKYDPFTMKEYYRVYAFLNGTADADYDDERPTMKVFGPGQKTEWERLRAAARTAEKGFNEAAGKPEIAEAQAVWEGKVLIGLTGWQALDPIEYTSAGGARLSKTESKSILAEGKNPPNDTYTVTAETDLKRITGIRLEVLETGPEKVLGRHPNGSFVLGKFEATASAKEGKGAAAPLEWKAVRADYSQDDYSVTNLLKGTGNGWAVAAFEQKNRVRRSAYFTIGQPLESPEGVRLTFRLRHESQFPQANIARFRLYVTDSEEVGPPEALPDDVRAILLTAAEARDEKQRSRLTEYFRSMAPQLKEERDLLAAARKVEREFHDAVPITSVLEELEKPRQTHLLIRGGFLSKGDKVSAGTPAVLHPLPPDVPANRLGLAHWLVDTNNPLTARVIMNRFWEQYFGAGLVETSEDFGMQGEKPTHPELLDWLGTEFMRRGWSMKAMHKLIVLSATYRQSSRVTPELIERDPFNRLYARGSRLRLEAEMIRDQALAVSGLLSRKIGGPSVMPPQPGDLWQIVYSGDKWVTSPGEDKYRRGLYTFWRRSLPHPAMTTFDAPTREFCVIKRSRSNTPLQALNLLNDAAYVEAAQALARRMMAEGGSTAEERARYGFRLCLARAPKSGEAERLVQLFERELEHYRRQKEAAEQMATSELGRAPKGMDVAELAAWTVVANVLLNLDETVTKG